MIIAQYRCNLQKLPDPWNSHNYRPWKLMQKRLKRLSPMELGSSPAQTQQQTTGTGWPEPGLLGSCFFLIDKVFFGAHPTMEVVQQFPSFFRSFFFWCMDVFFWIPCSNSLPESHPSHPKWIHRISGICWSDSQDPGLRIASFIAAEGGEVGEIFHDPPKTTSKTAKKNKGRGKSHGYLSGKSRLDKYDFIWLDWWNSEDGIFKIWSNLGGPLVRFPQISSTLELFKNEFDHWKSKELEDDEFMSVRGQTFSFFFRSENGYVFRGV